MLYYMDIRREKDIECIVEMLEKISKREDLQLITEASLGAIIEQEIDAYLPSVMLTGIASLD